MSQPEPTTKRISSPAATGGAGTFFEQHVAAYWLALLLVRGIPPVLRDCSVVEVNFQTERLGYDTDDFLVVGTDGSGARRRLLGQVKRSFTLSASDEDCRNAVGDFWGDFRKADRFTPASDCIVLVTLRGTNVLLEHFTGLLECARAACNASDFESRLATPGLVHSKVIDYCGEVRTILGESEQRPVSAAEAWPFLKTLYFLSLDLATSTALVENHVRTLLAHTSVEADPRASADATWAALLREASDGMVQAKTYTREALAEPLRQRHSPVRPSDRDTLAVADPLSENLRNLAAGVARHLRPLLATTTTNQPVTKAQEAVGRAQAKAWEERAKRSLDAQGQKLWEDIRKEVRALNHLRAVDAGQDLRAWLEGDGAYASSAIRGRVCVLMADLAVIDSALRSREERIDTSEARGWYTRALDEFGTQPTEEDAARLLYLEARLHWLDRKPEQALALLEGVEDASCKSLALSVLIAEGRDDDAVRLARAIPPDDRWCDRLVMIFAQAGLADEVEGIEAWAHARPDPVVSQRCVVARVHGTLAKVFRGRDGRSLFLGPIAEDDAACIQQLLQDLQPLVSPAVARGRPASGVETEAVELAFTLSRLLNLKDQWRPTGVLLCQANPVSLEYARAVIRGDLTDPGTLPTRLRNDYPQSILAGHMAAVVDVRTGATFAEVSSRVEALIPLADTPDQRARLSELLLERSLHEDGTIGLERALELAGRLLPTGHSLLCAIRYELLRRGGNEPDARALLASANDEADPLWLQIAAADAYRREDRKAALGYFLNAARLLCRPETCWLAFNLAHEQDDTAAMREMTTLLARVTPEDSRSHRNLAALEFYAGHFKAAAAALRRVVQLAPGNADDGIFLGRALVLSGSAEEAIEVLTGVCAAHPMLSDPWQFRAVVLDSQGRPVVAFEGLHSVRDRFWGDMGFVCLYHTLAYKANREEEAHFAFLRIQELQNGDPNGPLRGVTLDDLREHMRTQRERHEQLNSNILCGRLPWPLVGRALRRESYIDWAIRTQECVLPDAPLSRPEYTVYATNGYAVGTDSGGDRTLVPVTAASAGQPVVADLSALLTLHRLGLVDRTFAHFGRAIVPAGYLARFLEDHRTLQPHQRSAVEARLAILAALDHGTRLRRATERESKYPTLNEHHLEHEHPDFHLIDAVNWLRGTGRLTDPELARVSPVCQHPAAADPGTFRTAAARGFLVSMSTLVTAHNVGLLDRLLAHLKLWVEQEEAEQLRLELLSVQYRAEVMGWSRELHATLTGDPRVEPAEPERTRPNEEPDDREPEPVLDAIFLAEQRRLPLLTDDRCMQGMILNARQGRAGAAFGSDAVLVALAQAGAISEEELATGWLQLVRWRYRFLTPPPNVLITLAARHPTFPPGEELRDVSRYLHESCLDPALFCGQEPTTPPTSVGWCYFQNWVQVIGQFLMRVWHDPRFDERTATALTHWCASELLPPAPRNLGYSGHAIASQTATRIVLISAVVDPCVIRSLERSNAALRVMADAFCLTRDEYDTIMTAMVETELPTTIMQQHREEEIAARQLTAVAAFQDHDGLSFRTAATLADLGLIAQPVFTAGDDEATAIADATHPGLSRIPAGPWAALRGREHGESNEVFYVPDLIFHSSRAVRRAAVWHLSRAGECRPAWLTPRSLETVHSAEDICGSDGLRARSAAGVVETALAHDFLLLLARLRQSHALGWENAVNLALRALLEVRPGVLGSVPPDWYREPGQDWDEFLRVQSTETDPSVVLDSYYDRYGHLPLASRYAIESVVAAWLAVHGSTGVWDALRLRAEDSTRPLWRYHVCRVFFANPALVPPDQHAEVWSLAATLLGCHDAEQTLFSPCEAAAELLHALARHYHHTLEIEAVATDATSIAALAWWVAERVTREIVYTIVDRRDPTKVASLVRRFLTRHVRPLGIRSGFGAMLTRQAREPSGLVYATVFLQSLWRPAVLEAVPASGLTIPEELQGCFFETVAIAISTGFPVPDPLVEGSPYALDVPFVSVVARWASALPGETPPDAPDGEEPTEQADNSPASGSEHDPTADGAAPTPTKQIGVFAALRGILTGDEQERFLLLQQLRVVVHLGRFEEDEASWLFEDRAWWDGVFDGLAEQQLGDLSSTLVEFIRQSRNETWHLNFPHLFGQQATREALAGGRLMIAVSGVLQSSAVTGNYAALHFLLRPIASPALDESLATWRRRLQDIRRVLPAPVQAKLRTLLTFLPPEQASELF